MRFFNNTDVPVDFRDRVILPAMSLEYPSVTDQTLTAEERFVFHSGALGGSAGTALKVLAKLHLPRNAVVPVFSLGRLSKFL